MKKLFILLAALVMVFSLAACGGNQTADNGNGAMINVDIEIDYPDGSGQEDIEATLQVAEGTNAMDMLHQYAAANGIEVVLDETSSTIYVTSIGGVEQSADAGWIYEVDDEMTMEAADKLILTEGMEISWEYTSWDDM